MRKLKLVSSTLSDKIVPAISSKFRRRVRGSSFSRFNIFSATNITNKVTTSKDPPRSCVKYDTSKCNRRGCIVSPLRPPTISGLQASGIPSSDTFSDDSLLQGDDEEIVDEEYIHDKDAKVDSTTLPPGVVYSNFTSNPPLVPTNETIYRSGSSSSSITIPVSSVEPGLTIGTKSVQPLADASPDEDQALIFTENVGRSLNKGGSIVTSNYIHSAEIGDFPHFDQDATTIAPQLLPKEADQAKTLIKSSTNIANCLECRQAMIVSTIPPTAPDPPQLAEVTGTAKPRSCHHHSPVYCHSCKNNLQLAIGATATTVPQPTHPIETIPIPVAQSPLSQHHTLDNKVELATSQKVKLQDTIPATRVPIPVEAQSHSALAPAVNADVYNCPYSCSLDSKKEELAPQLPQQPSGPCPVHPEVPAVSKPECTCIPSSHATLLETLVKCISNDPGICKNLAKCLREGRDSSRTPIASGEVRGVWHTDNLGGPAWWPTLAASRSLNPLMSRLHRRSRSGSSLASGSTRIRKYNPYGPSEIYSSCGSRQHEPTFSSPIRFDSRSYRRRNFHHSHSRSPKKNYSRSPSSRRSSHSHSRKHYSRSPSSRYHHRNTDLHSSYSKSHYRHSSRHSRKRYLKRTPQRHSHRSRSPRMDFSPGHSRGKMEGKETYMSKIRIPSQHSHRSDSRCDPEARRHSCLIKNNLTSDSPSAKSRYHVAADRIRNQLPAGAGTKYWSYNTNRGHSDPYRKRYAVQAPHTDSALFPRSPTKRVENLRKLKRYADQKLQQYSSRAGAAGAGTRAGEHQSKVRQVNTGNYRRFHTEAGKQEILKSEAAAAAILKRKHHLNKRESHVTFRGNRASLMRCQHSQYCNNGPCPGHHLIVQRQDPPTKSKSLLTFPDITSKKRNYRITAKRRALKLRKTKPHFVVPKSSAS